jgi:Putative zinc-finger
MRCPDAKQLLSDGELEPSLKRALQEHLSQCAACRMAELAQRRLESKLRSSHTGTTVTPETPMATRISTDQIMRAIYQQKQITAQLEEIRQQQQLRMASMRKAGAIGAALGFLIVSSIPLLFLVMTIMQTNLMLKILSFLNGAIDTSIIIGQYLQRGLTLVMSNNWLLSGLAFMVIIMMGMWLRLMRTPQEA